MKGPVGDGVCLYGFGDFQFDPYRRRLLRGGEIVPLPLKAIEILTVLVQNPGKILERDRLMEAVWGETIVEDANLTVAISQLRKAFAQNGDPDQFIQTVSRVGYRFVAQVREDVEDFAPPSVEKNGLRPPVIRQEELISGNGLELPTTPAKIESGRLASTHAALPEPEAALPDPRPSPVTLIRSRAFRWPSWQMLAVIVVLALAAIG